MKKHYSLLIALLLCTVVMNAQQLTVATYNMRYDSKDDSIQGNGWLQRRPVIASLITFNDFDIFGTQEGFYHQLEGLKPLLPAYTYIGVGREDGKQKGEFSAIFYKKDKFKLLKNGNFWLSPDTEKPNFGWDAACIRVCSWGKFRDVKSGFDFWFFNVHMDHVGVEARRESAKLILSKIKQMCGGDQVILTGDFNVDQRNESYTLLNTSGVLKDAYELSPVRFAENGTFNSFNTSRKTDERIDHIFLSGKFNVLRYGILTDCYWTPVEGSPDKFKARVPSDHYPVVIRIEIKR